MSTRFAIDTNVLLYAHFAGFKEHATVRQFLFRALDDLDTKIVVTPLVLHEFLHVATDPRRFEPPLAMAEALATVRLYLSRSNVECLPVSLEAVAAAMDLIEQQQLGRKRIADALLAGTLLAHGVSLLITYNERDFAGIRGLRASAPPTV